MKLIALGILIANFFKNAFVSAWDTARIILLKSDQVKSGIVTMPFSGLSHTQANFIGILITLTPGTTTVSIDLENNEFQLHLLDLDDRDSILQAITEDFISPIRIMRGD